MKKILAFLALGLVILLTFCIRGYYKISRADDTVHQYASWINQFDARYSGVAIPEQLDFAGEVVPLHDMEIRKRFANEYLANAYWLLPSIFKDPVRRMMYRNIQNILKKEGIPDDFIYLVIAESQLLNKVSPKGAAGVWQIMPASAIALGLQINDFVDERYDYLKSTYAACRYLKQAYAELGSWTLAAASYNMGIGGISRKVSLHGTDDYYAMALNRETSAYLFRILSIKHVLTQKPIRVSNESLPLQTVYIDSSISDLEDFCATQGYDYLLIKQLNPWIMGNALPFDHSPYAIQVPVNILSSKQKENAEAATDTPIHIRLQNRLLSLFH
jgi:hypothetical protein